MEPTNESRTAALLEALAAGNAEAFEDIFTYFYSELKLVAASKMRQERVGHTLGATGLLHETFLRLSVRLPDLSRQTRGLFFGIAARAMEQILIERARLKRLAREPLLIDQVLDDLESDGTDLLALNEALAELNRLNQKQAQAIRLQFFAGLEVQEIADTLGGSKRTTEADLRLARAWLRAKLTPLE